MNYVYQLQEKDGCLTGDDLVVYSSIKKVLKALCHRMRWKFDGEFIYPNVHPAHNIQSIEINRIVKDVKIDTYWKVTDDHFITIQRLEVK